MADGLPSALVEDLAQDASGVMWFLTRRGITAYDGTRWTVENPVATPHARPWHLAAGRTGDLYLHSGRWCWRRTSTGWHELPAPPILSGRAVNIAVIEVGGAEWLALAGVEGRLHLYDGTAWSGIDVVSREREARIYAMAVADGHCALGSSDGVIFVDVKSRTRQRAAVELPDRHVRGLAYDAGTHRLWAVGRAWIARLDDLGAPSGIKIGLAVDLPQLDRTPSGNRYRCASDMAGGVYLGDGRGVFYYHPVVGLSRLQREHGVTSDVVRSVLRDREGNVWLAGPRGATKIVSRRFASYDRDHGLFADEVASALQRADGSIVLGHSGGLTFLGDETTRMRVSDAGQGTRIMQLAEDAAGNLLVVVEYVGVGRIGPNGFDLITTKLPLGPSGKLASVAGVLPRDDGLWVASSRGLHRYRNGGYSAVPLLADADELVSLRRIVADGPEGLLVATTAHGIFAVTAGSVRQWVHPDFPVRSTFTVLRDREGEIWAGSRGGLSRARPDGVLELSENPRVRRPVYALTEDHQGRLWIGTDAGIRRWDGRSLRTFGSADGVVGPETNRSAAFVDDSGRVWFGTDRGISVYDARFDVAHEHGPSVELLDVDIGGETRSLDRSVAVPYHTRTLLFRFRAISFLDEERVRFQTRLDGFDTDWSPPRLLPLREIRYTNLSPGNYRLNIRAIDAQGVVSEAAISAPIEVARPVWLQAWFVVLAALLGIAVLGGSVLLWLQRRYALRLESEVRVRTRELREMEREQENRERLESLGLLAGGIAHDFNNILTAIIGNVGLLEDQPDQSPESAEVIRDVEDACCNARELADQLLTFSRGGAPVRHAASVTDVIRDSARFVLRGSSVQVAFDLPEDLWNVEIDSGQISQVINNVMINARQAMTGGGMIRVTACNVRSTKPSRRFVRIEIADEGPGIPVDVIGRVFDPYFSTKGQGSGLGLATAHSIIRRHDGELSVTSPPGQGAIFCITLPASDVAVLQPEAPPIMRSSQRATVLVMDDQAAVRAVVRRVLEREHCTVLEAADGAEAVRLYSEALGEERRIDAVFMDLTIPGGMGGVEAATAVRKLDPSARIIVASGYSDDRALADPAAYGFAARISKPFKPADLIRTLADSLDEGFAGDKAEAS